MTNYDVVKKLIGKINPVGESNEDARRLKNLEDMCELAEQIIYDVNCLAFDFRDSHEASIRKSCEVADTFISSLREG